MWEEHHEIGAGLGLLPGVVSSLTVPELDRLERAKQRQRHFEAIRLQWFAAFIYEASRRGVRDGYLEAKGAIAKGHAPKLDKTLSKALDHIPGYDRTLARRR